MILVLPISRTLFTFWQHVRYVLPVSPTCFERQRQPAKKRYNGRIMCTGGCFQATVTALYLLFGTIAVKGVHHPPLHDIVTTQDIIAGDIFFEITDPTDLEYTYRLRPAKDFGSSFSRQLMGVALVSTVPSDGCTKLRNHRELRGNVALIERGECSFLSKTINAELAGASAAIITEFNNESSEFDYYIEMIHDNTSRDAQIPAGFLLGKNGLIIRSTLRRLKRSHAIINLPVNLTFTPPAQINHPPWLGW